MNKLVLLLVFPILSYAQAPIDYYLTAENYADDALKYELNQIIDDHIEFSYTSSSTDVWDILKETDKDPINPNNVILIYSGVSLDAAQEYNSGNGWTREHVWAKSRGDFGTTTGPGTDVHALRPLDNITNTIRNNRGFDNCTACATVYDKWSNNTNSLKDNIDWTFEPRNEVKGDVARMLFYMAVRYEGFDGYPDLELSESIMPSNDITPVHGKLSVLLDWHRNDPVDAWEKNRNDIIYYSYQGNRNPFIDHPEVAEHLWGDKIGFVWPETPLYLAEFSDELVELYPNPASNFINIMGLNDNTLLEVYDAVGRRIISKELATYQDKIDISRLNGVYVFRLTQGSKSIVKRIIVQ